MKAIRRREAEADQHFPAARIGTEQRRAACVLRLGYGQGGGGEHRAAMGDRSGVRVVEFQAVDQTAVDERGIRRACAVSLAEHGGRAAFGDVGGGARCAHELAGKPHAFTILASASRHGWASSAASPAMTFFSVSGTAGKTAPAFSASLERSVGSSKGRSAPPRALSTSALISAPSPKRRVTRAGRSLGDGFRSG